MRNLKYLLVLLCLLPGSGHADEKYSGFRHSDLPSFQLRYPKHWQLRIKPFGQGAPEGFESMYFPTCHEACMGLRLSGGSVSLEIAFDEALGDEDARCSNLAQFKSIGKGWYRIKDSSGYFYTKMLVINTAATRSAPSSKALASEEEWGPDQPYAYKFCVRGAGHFLREHKVDQPRDIPGWCRIGILMEHPRVKGKPDRQTLKEIDGIILSIRGLR